MSNYKVIEKAEICPKCRQITKYERKAFFCDNCGKQMSERLENKELRTTFWENEQKTEDYYFCSWKCNIEWIRKNRKRFGAEQFYFYTLPYITKENQAEFFKYPPFGRR